jgi:hypothetical protein
MGDHSSKSINFFQDDTRYIFEIIIENNEAADIQLITNMLFKVWKTELLITRYLCKFNNLQKMKQLGNQRVSQCYRCFSVKNVTPKVELPLKVFECPHNPSWLKHKKSPKKFTRTFLYLLITS